MSKVYYASVSKPVILRPLSQLLRQDAVAAVDEEIAGTVERQGDELSPRYLHQLSLSETCGLQGCL